MICHNCRNQDHESCKKINADKTPSGCDCQHRVEQKTIVLPSPAQPVITLAFKVEGELGKVE